MGVTNFIKRHSEQRMTWPFTRVFFAAFTASNSHTKFRAKPSQWSRLFAVKTRPSALAINVPAWLTFASIAGSRALTGTGSEPRHYRQAPHLPEIKNAFDVGNFEKIRE